VVAAREEVRVQPVAVVVVQGGDHGVHGGLGDLLAVVGGQRVGDALVDGESGPVAGPVAGQRGHGGAGLVEAEPVELLADLPGPVRAEFGSLSSAAREAMADMRRLLGVLRNDQPAAHAPQPVLADLPALVAEARQAGMTVELTAPARVDQVPPAAGVSAYRIIQEALTNAGRHAAGAPVAVSVRQDRDTVVLQVASGPGAAAARKVNGHRPGHGLTGMRERVELLGGSLSAGPAPDGSFVVPAVLPIGQRTAQP
jgi:Histidine kinase-, DNA gyrase B-, and HSP90-like ATPase